MGIPGCELGTSEIEPVADWLELGRDCCVPGYGGGRDSDTGLELGGGIGDDGLEASSGEATEDCEYGL